MTALPRFLLDESCDVIIERALDTFGADHERVSAVAPGQPDNLILDLALQHQQILITEDLDFGNLVYLQQRPCYGLILLRINDRDRQDKPTRLKEVVSQHGGQLVGSMTVITSDKVRIRPLLSRLPDSSASS